MKMSLFLKDSNLYSRLQEDLTEWMEVEPHEVLLTGARRWGKSLLMQWMARRLVYEWAAPHVEDVRTLVGGFPGQNVTILWVESLQEGAKLQVDELEAWLKGPQWRGAGWERLSDTSILFNNGLLFKSMCGWETANLRLAAYFNNAEIHCGHPETTAAHLERIQKQVQSVCIGAELKTTLPIPFLRSGLLAVASSRNTDDDLLPQRIMQWAGSKSQGIWHRMYAAWETKDAVPTRWFYVLLKMAGKGRAEEIELNTDRLASYWGKDAQNLSGAGFDKGGSVVAAFAVPHEYLEMFKANPRESLRDIVGMLWG